MKKALFYITLFCVLSLVSCKNDGYVKIDSINTFGNTLYRKEKVKVFVSAETHGTEIPQYEWGCDGGNFLNPQGLFENVWEAPNIPGKYNIWVTVERNGSKDHRNCVITVTDDLFKAGFEEPYYDDGYSKTNISSLQQITSRNGKGLAIKSSKTDASLLRKWASKDGIKAPYSMQLEFKSSKEFGLSIIFNSVPEVENKLESIRFQVNPINGLWRLICNEEDVDFGTDGTLIGSDIWKYISVSIDKDNKFIVYYDGNIVYESDILNEYYPQEYYPINGSGIYIPNANTTVNVDNITIKDNGEICTATEIE